MKEKELISSRNVSLDFCKGIGCIFVVLIHVTFPGVFGQCIKSLGSFAVPLFFMTSGYYCNNSAEGGYYLRKVRKLLLYLAAAVCLYGAYTILYCVVGENGFSFTLRDLCKILVLNDFTIIHGAQLWFLPALIYCYILWYFVCRFRMTRGVYCFIPIILAIKVLFLSSSGVPWQLRGNWLVTGIPYFALGNWFRMQKTWRNPMKKALLCGVGVGAAACLAYNLYPVAAVGTIVLSVSIFMYCMEHSDAVKQDNPIAVIGVKYSLTVYIVHLFIGYLTDFVFQEYASAELYLIGRPLIVVVFSVGAAVLFEKVKTLLSRWKHGVE